MGRASALSGIDRDCYFQSSYIWKVHVMDARFRRRREQRVQSRRIKIPPIFYE